MLLPRSATEVPGGQTHDTRRRPLRVRPAV